MDGFLSLQNQQQVEQMMAAIRQMTAVIHEYHDGLMTQGFPPEHALALTMALQNSLILNGRTGDGN